MRGKGAIANTVPTLRGADDASYLARLGGAIAFLEDPQLVLGGESSVL
jgi:hypothetical protein